MTMNLTEHPDPLTPEQLAATAAARLRSNDLVTAMLADWSARWPAVFTKPVPLAVGFSGQIRAALQGTGATRNEIGITIHRWTMQSAYLRAVMRGQTRRNLDGTEAGIPDDAAREHARKLLEERAIRNAARAKKKPDQDAAMPAPKAIDAPADAPAPVAG
jgi:sRNA-binding protein